MKTWETKSGQTVTRLLTGRSNVFLLSNGKQNLLIDTSPGSWWRLLDHRINQMSPPRVDYLVLTHTHYDHAENAARLKRKYNCQVLVHQREAPSLAAGENLPVKGTMPYSRLVGALFAHRIVKRFRYEPCVPDILVDSDYDLGVLGFNARIMHTPGHSRGSISLIIDDEIAVVGDCMFGVFRNSAFPPFADDPALLVRSWGSLLETNCTIFLPSHGSEKSRIQVYTDYNNRK